MSGETKSGGTILKYSSGTEIARLTNIGGIELTQDSFETTNHDSGTWRERIPTLRDGGELPCEGWYLEADAGQEAVAAHYAKDTDNGIEEMQIVWLNGSYVTFDAFVSKFKPVGDAPVGEVLPFSATFTITGEPVFTMA